MCFFGLQSDDSDSDYCPPSETESDDSYRWEMLDRITEGNFNMKNENNKYTSPINLVLIDGHGLTCNHNHSFNHLKKS